MDASHVFVSHSSADKPLVHRLHAALEPHGVDLWIDRRQMAAGDGLDEEIRASIEAAAHFIVILSTESLESDWVEKEIEYALEKQARMGEEFRVVPVVCAPLGPKTVKRALGKETVAVLLADVPGAFARAVLEILAALGLAR